MQLYEQQEKSGDWMVCHQESSVTDLEVILLNYASYVTHDTLRDLHTYSNPKHDPFLTLSKSSFGAKTSPNCDRLTALITVQMSQVGVNWTPMLLDLHVRRTKSFRVWNSRPLTELSYLTLARKGFARCFHANRFLDCIRYQQRD